MNHDENKVSVCCGAKMNGKKCSKCYKKSAVLEKELYWWDEESELPMKGQIKRKHPLRDMLPQ